MTSAVSATKGAARARPPRPNLRAVLYRVPHAPTLVVFEVPAATTIRSAVETRGTPRYVRVGSSGWRPWPNSPSPSWARSWGRAKQLDRVPYADPDPIPAAAEALPAGFEVSAPRWCSWPVHGREALRVVTSWTKAPGVMRTALLDGARAERVRNVAAQYSLAGLEERVDSRSFGSERSRSDTNDLAGGCDG